MAKKEIKSELIINDEELSQFKHIYTGLVQFSEVDSFGVAHNLKYFYWLEWARTDYLRTIGIKVNPRTFLSQHPFMTVHSEIDYFSPCKFGDKYKVYSRISRIGNSSIEFKNIITNNSGQLLIKASSVLVLVDPASMNSKEIDESFKNMVITFENNKNLENESI